MPTQPYQKLPIAQQISGVHHVGITVENMSQALEFYVEILGGKLIAEIKGICGDTMHNTLLQKEELDAISAGIDPISISVPDLRSGRHMLDCCFVKFNNLVIELLCYHDAEGAPVCGFVSGKQPLTSPALINSMHISFYLNEDLDVDLFVMQLEEECQQRGLHQVRCNRTVKVISEIERQKVEQQHHSCKITGNFEGLVMVYCKGPSGEQLEFNQVRGKAKTVFNHKGGEKS